MWRSSRPSQPRPSQPRAKPLEIRGQVRALGSKPASRVVEFYLDGVKKGQKPVELPPGGQVPVSFLTPPRLSEGEIHRGELKLSGTPDPLEFNDSRFFTFKVRPPLKVLLISDLAVDAEFVAAALDSRSHPFGDQRLRGENGPAGRARGQVPRLAPRPSGGLPAQRRGSRRGLLEPAQRLRARGGRAGDRPGRPLQRRELQRPDRRPDPPRSARPGEDRQGGDQLRQGRGRHSSPVPAVCQGDRSPPLRGARSTATGQSSRQRGRASCSPSPIRPALLERTFKGARTGRVLLWSTPLARRAGGAIAAPGTSFPRPRRTTGPSSR